MCGHSNLPALLSVTGRYRPLQSVTERLALQGVTERYKTERGWNLCAANKAGQLRRTKQQLLKRELLQAQLAGDRGTGRVGQLHLLVDEPALDEPDDALLEGRAER